MNIGSVLYEIQELDKELKRLRKKTTELNKRKKDLMNKAIESARKTGDTSVTFKGQTYTIEERSRHTRKSNKQKRKDTLNILQENGIEGYEAENMYKAIQGAFRGPEKVIYTLKK